MEEVHYGGEVPHWAVVQKKKKKMFPVIIPSLERLTENVFRESNREPPGM